MKIETKYSIDDKVWIIDGDTLKCAECPISEIYITVSMDNRVARISYRLGSGGSYSEDKLFETKQDLLNSL